MSADAAVLDAATRAFRDKNPMRWPCACIGCAVTIRMNYALLFEDASTRPAHAVEPNDTTPESSFDKRRAPVEGR